MKEQQDIEKEIQELFGKDNNDGNNQRVVDSSGGAPDADFDSVYS